MTSGIYIIENIINGKVYVGSTINIKKRWYAHKTTLNHNCHDNSFLQNAWNKYGETNFSFIILEEVVVEKLLEREQYYINLYDACNRNCGYNLMPTAGNNLGYKHTEETKLKISNINKGKILSEETKNNMKIAATKKDKSYYSKPERIIKISNANLGKKHSDETKKKLSKIRTGIKLSEETKKKIGKSNTGKIFTNERKMKISKALKGNQNGVGRIVTEETRKNISISHIGINRGEKNGRAMAITNENEVIAIRNDYNNGMTIRDLQIKYCRKYMLIYNIVKRITWNWLNDSSLSG